MLCVKYPGAKVAHNRVAVILDLGNGLLGHLSSGEVGFEAVLDQGDGLFNSSDELDDRLLEELGTPTGHLGAFLCGEDWADLDDSDEDGNVEDVAEGGKGFAEAEGE